MGFPLGFNGGQLHLLHITQLVAGLVTQQQGGENSGQTKTGSDGKGATGKTYVTAFQQVEGADGEHEHGTSGVTGGNGVNKLHLGNGVEDHGGKVGHLHTHGFKVKLGTNRVLHPAVGNQNPERREVGAKGYQPGTGQVLHA